MIDPPERIGPRLHKLREHLGLSQSKMAESLGISQPQWSQYESGTRKLTVEVACVLAERYAVTLDWLYLGNAAGLPMQLGLALTR